MTTHIETVIVGGGQAGLATSYFLKRLGHEHIVLEGSAHAANVWRAERWDSFTLVSPNWTLRMPGAEYDGPDPDGYMPRDEIVAYFDDYVAHFQLPVQVNTRVDAVEAVDGGYRVRTSASDFRARNVVIATGYEQRPKIPAVAAGLPPEIMQMHSSRYRTPESLPAGAVLVVGNGQSGSQIAEELYQHGRRVYLATGSSSGRVRRRYRGMDTFAWLFRMGFFDRTADQFPFPRERFAVPHVSGRDGGHTLNLHQFARDGVTLLGHLRDVTDGTVTLAPDLHENLALIDGFEAENRKMIDGFIQMRGLDVPQAEPEPPLRDGYAQPIIETLDLRAADIRSVIWATGYTFDYSLVKLPVQGEDGFPIQDRGVTNYPGLYFVGMPWMPTIRSGILAGVAGAAEHIAENIAASETRPDTELELTAAGAIVSLANIV